MQRDPLAFPYDEIMAEWRKILRACGVKPLSECDPDEVVSIAQCEYNKEYSNRWIDENGTSHLKENNDQLIYREKHERGIEEEDRVPDVPSQGI